MIMCLEAAAYHSDSVLDKYSSAFYLLVYMFRAGSMIVF